MTLGLLTLTLLGISTSTDIPAPAGSPAGSSFVLLTRHRLPRSPILKRAAPAPPKPVRRAPQRPGVVLEEDEPSPRDPKGQLFTTLGHGTGKPSGVTDGAPRGAVSRLAAASSLIYTLHTLLI